MKQRPLKMDAYGITYDEYMELFHFCQQYETKKRRLADMLTIRGSSPRIETYTRKVKDDNGDEKSEKWGCVLPHGQGATSDPVSQLVIRRERLARDIKLIEQAAIAADPTLYQYLIKAVVTKDGMRTIHPPCGDRQFRNARRRFFNILFELRNGYSAN